MSAIYANVVSAELRALRQAAALAIDHESALWADQFPAALRDDMLRTLYALRAQQRRQLRDLALYGTAVS